MPVTPSFAITQVNTVTSAEQVTSTPSDLGATQARSNRAIAVAADGSFAVTWSSQEDGLSTWDTFIRFFNADGTPKGGEIKVNPANTNPFETNQFASSIALLANGKYIVTWSDNNSELPDDSLHGVHARIFDPVTGAADGNEFLVNELTDGNQYNSSIATSANGNFVVTWVGVATPGDPGNGVRARVFTSDGTPVGSEFQVNTFTTSDQLKPTVSMANDGSFVVVWESRGQDGDGLGVYGQRYNAAGAAQGSEFQISGTTVRDQRSASVAMAGDGSFVVVWVSNEGTSGGGNEIYAQRYDTAGVAIGGEFRVVNFGASTGIAGDQSDPMVAINDDGSFIITWASVGNTQDPDPSKGVYARRFNAAGVPLENYFLVNAGTDTNGKDSTLLSQENASIAVKGDGEFVVTWTSQNQDGSGNGVFVQGFKIPASASPVLSPLTGIVTYTEGSNAIFLDNAITASDADSTDLQGATITIGGFVLGQDNLSFVNQNGILGNFNAATGVLALTGTASIANYQTALQSITYRNSSQDPDTTDRTITIALSDGVGIGSVVRTLKITAVNDRPSLGGSSTPLTFPERDAVAIAIDPNITITDPDSSTMGGAIVTVNGFVAGEDTIEFTNQGTISGTLVGGVLTLTGVATKAEYETALRSITFKSTSNAPTPNRTVEFQVNDGLIGSDTPFTRVIQIAPVDDPPIVTPTTAALIYLEKSEPLAIDAGLTVLDIDSPNLTGAKVKITNFVAGQDVLTFVPQAGITATDNGSGELTLSGTASVAAYQAALRSITYTNTSTNPTAGDRTLQITVNDGNSNSAVESRTITVTLVNDPPLVAPTNSALAYTENDGAVAIDDNLTLTDPDSTTLKSAKVTITGIVAAEDTITFISPNSIIGAVNVIDATTIEVDLSGTASVEDYQAALRAIKYANNSQTPTETPRTVKFSVTDDTDTVSLDKQRTITVKNTLNAPLLATTGDPLPYLEDAGAVAIDPGLTVDDIDSPNLASAKIQIGGYVNGQDLLSFTPIPGINITATWDATNGVLDLVGNATKEDYQTALRTVAYTNSSANPTGTTRAIRFRANDGVSDGNTATRTLQITGVNNKPAVIIVGSSYLYTENAGAVFVDGLLTVSDADDVNLVSATVTIDGYVNGEDTLSFVTQPGINGTFDVATGKILFTGSATVADYQTTLRSLKYTNTSNNPTASTRSIQIQVNDGRDDSSVVSRGIQVTANTPPVITPSTAALSYSDGQGPAVIDDSLSVTDLDSLTLSSATITIDGYIATEDQLAFTNALGIVGSFNAVTGVLTLSGIAPLADYQTALRSVTYTNSNPTPSTAPRTLRFLVNDGVEDSPVASRVLQIVVNAAPVITTSVTALPYTENQGAVALTTGLTITDSDNTTLTSATVTLSGYVAGEDVLAFGAVPAGITAGAFDSATGSITFTGTADLATYGAFVATLTYTNTSNNPTSTPRTLQIKVNDGIEDSATVSRSIQIAANAAPVVVMTASTLVYEEGQGAIAFDPGLSVSDADSLTLTGATVTIGSYVATEDTLAFVNQGGISGSFDATTGILTLTGTATLAQYQAALRTVTYSNSSANPTGTTRILGVQVNDGIEVSGIAGRTIQVNTLPTPPSGTGTATPLNYTENDGAVVVNPGITLSDPDSTDLTGAVVTLTGYVRGQDVLSFVNQGSISGTFDAATGVLTLAGTATIAQYQAALQSVTYLNTSSNPSTTGRQVEMTVSDGTASNNPPITRSIVITATNTPPSLSTSTTPLAYSENAGAIEIDRGIVVTDSDSPTLTGATVSLDNFVAGQDVLSVATQNGISGSFANGVLILTGSSSVANYQTALRSITYSNNSTNPDPRDRIVNITVTDGTAVSNIGSRTIQVTAVNNPPALVTSSDTLTYLEGAGAIAIDAGITVSDADSVNLASATIALVGYVPGQDSLSFVTQNGITGVFNASTGVMQLTGSATVANYQAALRAVTYTNSSANPNTTPRTLRLVVNDGSVNSAPVDRSIRITEVNTPPVVTTTPGAIAYGENAGAVVIDGAIVVTDLDNPTLSGATVTIGGYVSGEDVLSFTNQGGIFGNFNAATGVLTLSGSASLANYQVALRSLTYTNTSTNPNLTSRTVQFTVTDGVNTSAASSRTIQISQLNSPPVVATTASSLSYAEQAGAVAIDPGIFVLDSDSANITGATVTLTGYVVGQDNLLFVNQNGISGSFNAATGVLTLTGTAPLDSYQTALRSVAYLNSSATPNTASRSVQITVTDGIATSNLASRNINVTAVNDAPKVTILAPTVAFSQTTGAIAIAPNLSISDADGTTLSGATVTLGGFLAGQDSLIFSDQNGITGSFNALNGVLELTGTATLAQYQAALRSLIYSNNSETPATTPRTISISVTDGITPSAPAAVQVTFDAVQIVPVLDLNGAGAVGIDFSSTFVIGGAPIAVAASDARLTGGDRDIASAQVRISNLRDGAAEELLVDTADTGISAVYGDGTLSLAGSAPLSSYLQVLRTVQYVNRLDNPDRATRVLLFTVSDGTTTSEPAQTTVQVAQVNLNAIVTTPATDVIFAPGADNQVISVLENLQQNDTVDGGAGSDTLVLTNGRGTAVINVANATNQVSGILTGITTIRNFEHFDFSGFAGNTVMNGSDTLADDLIGGAGNDEFHGAAGNDRLSGNDGNDLLDGGSGNDAMNGGGGDDIYIVDSLGDAIVEGVDTGFDTVQSALPQITLGANLENLLLIGGAASGSGNELDNDITGNDVNNLLSGNDGADFISGLNGKDTLVGGLGDDRLEGGAGRDRLSGDSGDDNLTGGRGRDRLKGGKGKDAFFLDLAKRSSRDTIADFKSSDDTIGVAREGFSTELNSGAIAPNQLAFGIQAERSSDRFIYNQSSGDLFFDADGTGAKGQIWIARLANRASINSSDIVVSL